MSRDGLNFHIHEILDAIQVSLYERALAFRKANTSEPENYREFCEQIQNTWAFCWWCGNSECEAKIKDETKATARCIPLEQPGGQGSCIVCGAVSKEKVYFARAY